jgi:Ca-activated chloride channel homolog
MFEFAWPWMIALAPLPLLVWGLSFLSRKVRPPEAPEILFPYIGRLKSAFSGQVVDGEKMNWSYHTLLGLGWLCLVAALMQPQLTDQYTAVKNRGHDLMLAVDLSGSMRALDLGTFGHRINRTEAVKEVVERFVQERQGDRIGLILFGQHAYLDVPLTADTLAVGKMLDNAEIGEAGDSTAIGDALGVAVSNLRNRPGKDKVVILLTDGADNASTIPPLQAAKLAKQYGIRVYTVGVGSTGPVPFPDQFGQIVMAQMDLDEDLLRQIADMTGGKYFRATDEGALQSIYQSIDQLEKTESETPSYAIHTPLYRYPLGAVLALVLLLAMTPVYRSMRHEF